MFCKKKTPRTTLSSFNGCSRVFYSSEGGNNERFLYKTLTSSRYDRTRFFFVADKTPRFRTFWRKLLLTEVFFHYFLFGQQKELTFLEKKKSYRPRWIGGGKGNGPFVKGCVRITMIMRQQSAHTRVIINILRTGTTRETGSYTDDGPVAYTRVYTMGERGAINKLYPRAGRVNGIGRDVWRAFLRHSPS